MSGKLLKVEEAAKYLGMSPAWLYASGIPRVKFGRSRRYRQVDLDAYAADRVVKR